MMICLLLKIIITILNQNKILGNINLLELLKVFAAMADKGTIHKIAASKDILLNKKGIGNNTTKSINIIPQFFLICIIILLLLMLL